MQRNGRVNSSDISIFHRVLGARGNSQHEIADQTPQKLVAPIRQFSAGV